jgi:hypothetical protein
MEPKEILTKRKIEKLAEEYGYKGDLVENNQIGNEKCEVFVSHSSRDVEFINKVLLFLKNGKGVNSIYVDWQDPDMKHETDAQTAVDLKDRIDNAQKVIYVVTSESLKSVWCSWEIGYADCSKGVNNIAILAIKPNNGRWKNHEFLQQYPWISYDQKERLFMVTTLNGKRESLYDWLKDKRNIHL